MIDLDAIRAKWASAFRALEHPMVAANWRNHHEAIGDIRDLLAEVERLQGALANAPWKASYMAMRDERDELRAEVDRLRAEVCPYCGGR